MRAYLRVDPELAEKKSVYPDGAFVAFVTTLCAAEQQPHRGRFKSAKILRAYLGRHSRWIKFLVDKKDLIELEKGVLYVDGWDEWQEGDWKVNERVQRIRNRQRVARPVTVDVTPDVTVDVTAPRRPLTVPDSPLEHLAVSRKPLATSIPDTAPATNGASLDALLKQHDPDDDLGLQLAVRMTQLLGRDLAPMEVSMCSIFVDDFAYLSVDDMVERARSHVAHCKATKLPLPQKMHGFRETLRLQNDHVADSSGVKAWRPPPVAGDLSQLASSKEQAGG